MVSPNNKQGSLRRLESLLKKLQKEHNLLAQYDEVIKDQMVKGVVESVFRSSGKRILHPTH